MAPNKISCPVCGQSDPVFKVSHIYLESMAANPVKDETMIPRVLGWPAEKPARSLRTPAEASFLRQFKPPAGSRQVTRLINPDMVVVLFSAFAVFMLYQIATQQPPAFWFALILMVSFLIFYFLRRKHILARFEAQLTKMKEETEQAQKRIEHWTQIYYCTHDMVVFQWRNPRPVALAQINEIL